MFIAWTQLLVNSTFEWEAKGILNPSYLAIHPQQAFSLRRERGLGNFAGQEGGGVSAFSIDPTSGELNLLNAYSSQGKDPCYISIEQTGRFALVANYSGGNAAMLPIQADGQLGPATDVVQHSGSSVDPKRQTDPHRCIASFLIRPIVLPSQLIWAWTNFSSMRWIWKTEN